MDPSEDCICGGSVLAVDDCPTMRELLRASLASQGFCVHVVDSGRAALDAVTDVWFDVIVLDVEMPGLDGMAVGRALRGAPRTAAAAIVMHSSMPESEVRAGFDQYDLHVPKSADPARLGLQIGRLLRTRRMGHRMPTPAFAAPTPTVLARTLAAD